MSKPFYISLALLVALVAVALAVYLAQPPAEPPVKMEPGPIEKAQEFYASRAPFERPRPYTEVPEGLASLSAESCGGCHREIYNEWAVSTHRRAWLDDAQFQHELKKSRGELAKEGDPRRDVGWLCVNCHTPLVNQLPQLVVGLEDGDIAKPIYVDNPKFDEKLQLDAITCATCHVRDGVILGPHGDGTHAPHPVKKDESLLKVDICTSCHQAEMVYEVQQLGCFFSTGREWKESPAGKAGQTCQSCHMPEVERKVAEAFDVPKRKTRRHWFGGSLIPKKPEYEAEIAPLREVYPDGVTLTLVSGETFSVRVANDQAGHHMPSGDPERHIDVEVEVLDGEGNVIETVNKRLGTKYKWWPKIELESDTRIPAGEHVDIAIPEGGTSVRVRAFKYRMYKDAFDYHELEGKYVRGRKFFEETWPLAAD